MKAYARVQKFSFYVGMVGLAIVFALLLFGNNEAFINGLNTNIPALYGVESGVDYYAATIEAGKAAGATFGQVSGLHPPQLDDFGLLPTLRWYGDEVKERFGLAVTVSSRGERVNLPIDVRTVLFRIVQESLTNVIRHAQTDKADVLLALDVREVRIRVEDDGCGFDVNATLHKSGNPCWGLLGMIERATLIGVECQFVSEPGIGTIVEVLLPLGEERWRKFVFYWWMIMKWSGGV